MLSETKSCPEKLIVQGAMSQDTFWFLQYQVATMSQDFHRVEVL